MLHETVTSLLVVSKRYHLLVLAPLTVILISTVTKLFDNHHQRENFISLCFVIAIGCGEIIELVHLRKLRNFSSNVQRWVCWVIKIAAAIGVKLTFQTFAWTTPVMAFID